MSPAEKKLSDLMFLANIYLLSSYMYLSGKSVEKISVVLKKIPQTDKPTPEELRRRIFALISAEKDMAGFFTKEEKAVIKKGDARDIEESNFYAICLRIGFMRLSSALYKEEERTQDMEYKNRLATYREKIDNLAADLCRISSVVYGEEKLASCLSSMCGLAMRTGKESCELLSSVFELIEKIYKVLRQNTGKRIRNKEELLLHIMEIEEFLQKTEL
ncbi:hypothetical protein WKV44_09600 [Spirochaetia bacterium 38H-sp]|uniref:Uncharacterized protein n=1 Tax=Rarispira pelagica TaxID=3141764 RepID=A0ABU9UDP1_9SPIR